MRIAASLSLLLAVGTLHAKTLVPEPSQDVPRAPATAPGRIDGTVTVKPESTLRFGVQGIIHPDLEPLASIQLDRDFRDAPPGNLVRGTLEAANGEND